jgi:membrane protein DedA with SNARE-associated domain
MNPGAIMEWVLGIGAGGGFAGAALLLIALAAATFFSDDLACVAAGLLVAAEKLGFWPATLACFCGIVAGDLVLVAIGRGVGRAALGRWPLRGRVSEERLARAEVWFAERGGPAILASRFLPGTRLPLYLAAGVLRAPWGKLTAWFALAVALWAPLLVGASWMLGETIGAALATWAGWMGAALALAAAAWTGRMIFRSARTWRGRRLWVSRWRRTTRWEYWPMWAVYPPVVVYILWLAIRHGGLTTCTATNPGMGAAGGLMGESKSEILRGLAGAGERVARWAVIEPGAVAARATAVAAFQTELVAAGGAAWPVVLKPDVGERGQGVVIARNEAQVSAKLTADASRLIAQAYIPGVEFGLFYVRHPDTERGKIFAVTDKRILVVNGDGRRTLEELILEDERAVGMAAYFFNEYAGRLDEIPAAGAAVTLAELGTHCRGALFLDGAEHVTPALENAVDAISRVYDGFYFGRYDVRTVSAEALRRGEFTVIELNGLSSEATSIYDPRHSVFFGWRTLCAQWRLAYEIGAANRRRGARVWTKREVWRLVTRGEGGGA